MLGAIRAVTTVVADLDETEAAYTDYLGYRIVEQGVLSPAMVEAWGAPKAAGRRFSALAPESGEKTFLRFVENAHTPPLAALTSFGWNATELTVQAVDALAERLAGSPFRIIGPPRNLDGFPDIRAMQVIAPGGECLYLTTVPESFPMRLAPARSFVGRVFISVIAGPSMADLKSFYQERFSATPSDTLKIAIDVISEANGRPAETLYPLSIVPLDDGTLVELDEFPAGTPSRPTSEGDLPPGIAIVTFETPSLDRDDLISAPALSAFGHFAGRRCATLLGPVGERIELVEAEGKAAA